MTDSPDVFSFGGGVQSTAALVLAARGEIDFGTFLMADVGHDTENPATLDYIAQHSRPYAEAHGLRFEVIHRQWRGGRYRSILGYLHEVRTSVPIPVYLPGAGPSNRLCTIRWKIEPVGRWQAEHGATAATPGRCALGISTDEIDRMRTKPYAHAYADVQKLAYPLIDLGISRDECARIIAEAGLPPAPKSSCWFCPFQHPNRWREMRVNDPDRFAQAVDLEAMLIARREGLGRDPGHLAPIGGPLTTLDDQQFLFDPESALCGSSCFT